MFFDFQQYYRGCCLIPLSVVIFVLPAFLWILYQSVCGAIQHSLDSTKLVSVTLVICISLFFLVINVGRLVNGGWALLRETESDAITFTGRVESIEPLNVVSFPRQLECDTNNNDSYGVRMVIGGMECTVITNGSFSIGDNVLITYLPQSKFVLSMSYSLTN